MLTKLVKRLSRLEPVSPAREGIVSFSIGDFSELQLLALRQAGVRGQVGCSVEPAKWEDGRETGVKYRC
jgi:hypothetical protein